MDGDVVTDFAHEVKACALGQASSSIIGAACDRLERPAKLRALRETVRRMLKENGEPPKDGKWADIAVLEPVRELQGAPRLDAAHVRCGRRCDRPDRGKAWRSAEAAGNNHLASRCFGRSTGLALTGAAATLPGALSTAASFPARRDELAGSSPTLQLLPTRIAVFRHPRTVRVRDRERTAARFPRATCISACRHLAGGRQSRVSAGRETRPDDTILRTTNWLAGPDRDFP